MAASVRTGTPLALVKDGRRSHELRDGDEVVARLRKPRVLSQDVEAEADGLSLVFRKRGLLGRRVEVGTAAAATSGFRGWTVRLADGRTLRWRRGKLADETGGLAARVQGRRKRRTVEVEPGHEADAALLALVAAYLALQDDAAAASAAYVAT
jgi:hypothetical protein